MIHPKPESDKAPIGFYQFRIEHEELVPFVYQTKNGEKNSKKLKLTCTAIGDNGEYRVVDSILPWEDRYRHLLDALQVDHASDTDLRGMMFSGEIIHDPDKRDPLKSYARIVKIGMAASGNPNKADDDIPF